MKIVVLGAGGVGKSCCTLRYLFGTFQTGYDPTVGMFSCTGPSTLRHNLINATESNFTKQVQIDGKDVTLEILDTAGQEEFRAFRDASLRQGDGYLLVYSIDDRTSFEEVLKTFTYVTRGNEGRQYKVMVIGNKSVTVVVQLDTLLTSLRHTGSRV